MDSHSGGAKSDIAIPIVKLKPGGDPRELLNIGLRPLCLSWVYLLSVVKQVIPRYGRKGREEDKRRTGAQASPASV